MPNLHSHAFQRAMPVWEAMRVEVAIAPIEVSNQPARIQRIIVLSRVTLGADVAITSVIIERMKRNFPLAEIVLAGGSKAPQLFGGGGCL